MIRIALAPVAVISVLAFVGAAVASTHPTPAQTTAIKAAVKAYITNPSNHAASDNKVVKIAISSVNKTFAGANLTSASGNSTALLKSSGKTWKVIGFSATQPCSLAPKAVRTDLGVKCGQQ